MKNSKQLLRLFAVLVLLVFAISSIQAQEKETKEQKKRKSRKGWVGVHPPAPVPPITPLPVIPAIGQMPVIPPMPPLPPMPPMPVIGPIDPIAPIAPTAVIAPISPVIPVPPVEGTATWYHYDGGNKGLTIKERNGFYTEVKGKLRLDKDKQIVKSLSRNGYVKVRDKNTGQEILVEEEDGVLYYNYYNRGRKLPFEKEGKAWLKEIWRDFARQVGR